MVQDSKKDLKERKSTLKQFQKDIQNSYDNYEEICGKQIENVEGLYSFKNCRTASLYAQCITDFVKEHRKDITINIYERLLAMSTLEIGKCDAEEESTC